MTERTIVIVYSTDNQASADAIETQLTDIINAWPDDVYVAGATITGSDGNITGLPSDATPAAPSDQASPQTAEAPTQEAASDPDADPTQSLSTGREF